MWLSVCGNHERLLIYEKEKAANKIRKVLHRKTEVSSNRAAASAIPNVRTRKKRKTKRLTCGDILKLYKKKKEDARKTCFRSAF